MKYYLAIDIGASSGRHILGYIQDNKIITSEIYRFENKQIQEDGRLCWDIDYLVQNVINGLKQCKKMGVTPVSIGVDTWAVDFVLIDENGERISKAVSYRDDRTKNMREIVDEIIPFDEHYNATGIQYQPFNTVYQLMALKQTNPDLLNSAYKILMLPDYLNFVLTGKIAQEYTNATSTALVNKDTRNWDYTIIEKLGLPTNIFCDIKQPGEKLGALSKKTSDEIGFNSNVILPPTHDTASAFVSMLQVSEENLCISSGTWSLLGAETKAPIATKKSMDLNFTNEGGYNKTYRFLKNIMGLWILQNIKKELNSNTQTSLIEYVENIENYTFETMAELAKSAHNFETVIDVDDRRFFAPKSMIEEVVNACKAKGEASPNTISEVLKCVYISLAHKYSVCINQIKEITNIDYKCLNIFGGGCQDKYLNYLTAKTANINIVAGPVEATALGNLSVQMITDKTLRDIKHARDCIKKSYIIEEIVP